MASARFSESRPRLDDNSDETDVAADQGQKHCPVKYGEHRCERRFPHGGLVCVGGRQVRLDAVGNVTEKGGVDSASSGRHDDQ